MLSGRILLIGLIAVLAVACGPAGDVRGTWTLDSRTVDGVIHRPVSDHPVTLVVDHSAITGNSGCNDYGNDEAEFSGGAVSIPDVWTTLAGCIGTNGGDDLQAFEAAYQRALTQVDRYTITDGQLIIDGTAVTLVFTLN